MEPNIPCLLRGNSCAMTNNIAAPTAQTAAHFQAIGLFSPSQQIIYNGDSRNLASAPRNSRARAAAPAPHARGPQHGRANSQRNDSQNTRRVTRGAGRFGKPNYSAEDISALLEIVAKTLNFGNNM